MTQNDPITEANRIAVTKLFRQIAEYGREIRERRSAEAMTDKTIAPETQMQTVVSQEREQN
jgi:hypothetical protein